MGESLKPERMEATGSSGTSPEAARMSPQVRFGISTFLYVCIASPGL